MLLFRKISALFICILQQGFILFMAILLADVHLALGIGVALLCIPMFKMNKLTYRYILKYGLIRTFSANADTSEIDVKKEDRWPE